MTDSGRGNGGRAADRAAGTFRRLRRALLVAAATTAALLGANWGDDWDGIREAGLAVRTVKTSFVQEKRLPILARPLRSEGSFYFRAPGALRWEYRTPVRSILLLDGADIRRWVQRDGALVEESGGQLEAMRVVLEEISTWMAGDFSHSEAFTAELKPGEPPRIVLTPKQEAISRFVRHVVITLDERPGVLAAIDIEEGEDASTHIEFRDTELNTPLADELFTQVE
jgi:outer membrane lipoprotein carrier protein